ncbi:sigma factor-like helix-turn-helix DNA-binding protein [Streptomyces sp. NPDC056697]|uniref:sigma factor-like helix-turn-helix DNA-binding protein n=1 Tax=Streptomyces sp. NPDC056697 TaxID=3345915 RepID=UPI003698C055
MRWDETVAGHERAGLLDLLKLSDAQRRQITAARSWLAKTAGGICLNRLSRPHRGATRTVSADAEGARAGLVEEVSRVLLNALDCLPPPERAVFVLHDAFGMEHDTVADIVGRTERHGVLRRRRPPRRTGLGRPQPRETALLEPAPRKKSRGDVENP